MIRPDLIVGWPNAYWRREVRRRSDQSVVGYIIDGPPLSNRYFAEDRHGLPIEGTHKSVSSALRALMEEVERGIPTD